MVEGDGLTELQMQLSFQEDAIHQLEQAQEQQRREIEMLGRLVRNLAAELNGLRRQLDGGQGEDAAAIEKPPHY